MDIASFLIGYQTAQSGASDKVDKSYQYLAEALLIRNPSYISDDPTVIKLDRFVASDGEVLAALNEYSFAGFTEVEAMKFTDVYYVMTNALVGDKALKVLDITVPSIIAGIVFEPNALAGCSALESVICRCDATLKTVNFRTDGATGTGSNSSFYVYVPAASYDKVIGNVTDANAVSVDRFRKLEDYPVIDKWGQKFTINFYNGDTLLKSSVLDVGEMPICEEPTKEGWKFDGWEPAIAIATADVDYHAKWTDAIASGTLGDNINWKILPSGEMTISGEGAMPDYTTSNYSNAPWYAYNSQITSVKIEDGITHIGSCAFYMNASITRLTMADSVVSVGDYAFSGCGSITNTQLSGKVESIGASAFSRCKNMVGITIPNTLRSIGKNAFYQCWYALTSVDIPSGVTVIPETAFYECTTLTSVTIPATVKKIEKQAFKGSGLSNMVFEDTSGWYYASSSTATSGTNFNPSWEPSNVGGFFKTGTYANYYYFDAT